MSESHGHLEGNDEAKQAHLKRLRRIEGQVRGLQRMVEEDKYCIDILTQVSAATKALQSVSLGCSTTTWATASSTPPAQGGAEQEQKLKEALRRDRPPRAVLTDRRLNEPRQEHP